MSITGLPTPADLVGSSGWLDYYGLTLRSLYAGMGINAPGESGTAAVDAYNQYLNVQALAPTNLQAQTAAARLAMQARWDKYFLYFGQIVTSLDNIVTSGLRGLPFVYVVKGVTAHALDAHLLRLNACHSGVPLPFAQLNASNTTAGTMTNLATGSSSSTLTDSGRIWSTNQWQTYTVVAVAASGVGVTYAPVASNTSTAITITGSWSNGTPASTAAYCLANSFTLTAANSGSGAIPNCSSGNAPDIIVNAVGANDYDESIVAVVTHAGALTGANNAYTLALSGIVPTPAPRVLRIRRTKLGGHGSGLYFFDQDVPNTLTAGSAWSGLGTITLTKSDPQLLPDGGPPSFLSCLLTPEEAWLIASCYATAPPANTNVIYNGNNVAFPDGALPNPANVAMNPANGFMGYSPASSAIFGTTTNGVFAAGTVQTANNAAAGVQGVAGAYGDVAGFKIRARVTTTLDGTRTPTILYVYYDILHPHTPITKTGLAADSGFAGSIAGEEITFSIPPGRLVISLSETSATGTMTTGVYVYEAVSVR